jgi:hypothetical protein
VRISVTELARAYHLRHWATYHKGLAPFVLQRFFQGRVIEIDPPGGSVVTGGCLLWAFALDDVAKPIPIWFSLRRQESSDRPIEFCEKCWGGPVELYPHRLFSEARCFIKSLWLPRRTSALPRLEALPPEIQIPRVLGDLQRSRLCVWRSRLDYTVEKNHSHKLYVTAVYELKDPSPFGSEGIRQRASVAMENCVRQCLAIFLADEKALNNAQNVPVYSSLRLAAHAAPLKPIPTEGVSHASPEKRAVDRLLERAGQLSRRRFNPLNVLAIRRCGEPRGEDRAHARFAFGETHWKEVERCLQKKIEKQTLVQDVARIAQDLLVRKDDEQKLRSGLEALGLPASNWPDRPRLEEALAEIAEGKARGLPDNIGGTIHDKILLALKKSFPVETVVSNRIMGHGCTEFVLGLWKSPGLISTLGDYPRDLLIAERVVLPFKVGKELYYVPLQMPASRNRRQSADYFLFFAVLMCPPDVIAPEVFRQLAEEAADDLYLAFLEEVQAGLGDAAEIAVKCQKSLIYSPERTKAHFEELSARIRGCKLDLIRLADFAAASPLQETSDLYGVPWPACEPGKTSALRHEEPLRITERIADQLRISARVPRDQRGDIVAAAVLDVGHSGLLWELKEPRAEVFSVIEELRGSSDRKCSRAVERLSAVQSRLEEIQKEWTLLPKRLRGELGWEEEWRYPPSINETRCRQLFDRAFERLKFLSGSSRDVVAWLEQHPPTFQVSLADHAILELEEALLQLFVNLLSNTFKHELRSGKVQPVGNWGLDVSFQSVTDLRNGSVGQWLARVYQGWRDDLKNDGACLIRAYPCTISREELLKRYESSDPRSAMGLWSLATITRAYIAEQEAGLPFDARVNGVLVLVPATRRAGRE